MKSEVFAAFCSIVVVATVLKANDEPGGTILLRLNSLENKNSASGCCSSCVGLCNYQLEIWATCDIRRKNNSECLYGYSKTGILSSTSSIIFRQSLGNGLRNPLAYNFSLFRGTLGFQILVTNQSELQIDEYIHHVALYPKSNTSIIWKSINLTATGFSDSRLNLAYSVFCNAHYYGPSCVVGCIPGETYTCVKATGRKLCIGQWLGPECNCKQTSKYNCDGTGKKICYPPWYGENCDVKCEAKNDSSSGYSCNKTTGEKTCLDGWYGNQCNLRTPLVQGVLSSSPPGPNSTTIAATRKIWQRTLTRTSQQPSRVFHQSSKQPYSYILNHASTTETAPQSCLSSLCFVTSSVATSYQPTSSEGPIGKSVNNEEHTVTPEVLSETTKSIIIEPHPTSWKTSSEGPIGTSVNNKEHTVTPEVLSETTKSIMIEPHPTSWKTSSEGPIGTSVNNKEHTVTPEVLPETTKSIMIEPHPTSWKTSSEGPIGTSVNNKEHTVTPEVLPETTKSIMIEPHPTSWKTSTEGPIGTSVNNEGHTVRPETSSVRDTKEIEPGSHEARKKQDIWWMVLLPFALVALLVAAVVVILKKRGRAHRKNSPTTQCEIPLEETQVQEESNTHNNQTEDAPTPSGANNDGLTKIQP